MVPKPGPVPANAVRRRKPRRKGWWAGEVIGRVSAWWEQAVRASGNPAGAAEAEMRWRPHGSFGYHYDGRARFFLRLSDECADAMLKLMGWE